MTNPKRESVMKIVKANKSFETWLIERELGPWNMSRVGRANMKWAFLAGYRNGLKSKTTQRARKAERKKP
jgi:hypothetical protein